MEEEVLKQEIKEQIMTVAEKILDYCDVSVPDHGIYRRLRSKILRVTNNGIRNLNRFVETDGKDNRAEKMKYSDRVESPIVEYKVHQPSGISIKLPHVEGEEDE